MPILRKHGAILLGAALVPAFFALAHVSTSGFPMAEGCSGAGPVAPVVQLTLIEGDAAPDAPLAVAQDGLFLIDARSPEVTPTSSGVRVEATDSAGSVILGQLKTLQAGMYRSQLGWKANAPLGIGQQLNVKVSLAGASPLALTRRLTVAGAPAQLDASGVMLGDWRDFAHGIGDPISCPGRASACGGNLLMPAQLMLRSAEQLLRSVSVTWTPPADITGFVAWEGHVELPDGQPPVWPPGAQQVSSGHFPPQEMGRLVFPAETTDYCAVLVVRDVWTGASQRSQICGIPPSDLPVSHEYPVLECDKPPNEALTWAWCQPQAHWSDPACARFFSGAGGGPPQMAANGASAGGVGSASGGSPPMSGTAGSLGAVQPASALGRHTSSACQFAGPPSESSALLAMLTAAASIYGLRRSLRPRG